MKGLYGGIKTNEIVKNIKKAKIMKTIRAIRIDQVLKKRKQAISQYGYVIINFFHNISIETNIPIWVFWGTLLGLAREGALLSHDYDMDFVMGKLPEESLSAFRKKLYDFGLKKIREFRYKGQIIGEAYEYAGVILDIDYCEFTDNAVLMYEYEVSEEKTEVDLEKGIQIFKGLNIYQYSFPLFKIIETEFKNGTACLAPENMEYISQLMYGESWKIPDKKHDWKALGNYKFLGFIETSTGWATK